MSNDPHILLKKLLWSISHLRILLRHQEKASDHHPHDHKGSKSPTQATSNVELWNKRKDTLRLAMPMNYVNGSEVTEAMSSLLPTFQTLITGLNEYAICTTHN